MFLLWRGQGHPSSLAMPLAVPHLCPPWLVFFSPNAVSVTQVPILGCVLCLAAFPEVGSFLKLPGLEVNGSCPTTAEGREGAAAGCDQQLRQIPWPGFGVVLMRRGGDADCWLFFPIDTYRNMEWLEQPPKACVPTAQHQFLLAQSSVDAAKNGLGWEEALGCAGDLHSREQEIVLSPNSPQSLLSRVGCPSGHWGISQVSPRWGLSLPSSCGKATLHTVILVCSCFALDVSGLLLCCSESGWLQQQ